MRPPGGIANRQSPSNLLPSEGLSSYPPAPESEFSLLNNWQRRCPLHSSELILDEQSDLWYCPPPHNHHPVLPRLGKRKKGAPVLLPSWILWHLPSNRLAATVIGDVIIWEDWCIDTFEWEKLLPGRDAQGFSEIRIKRGFCRRDQGKVRRDAGVKKQKPYRKRIR